MIAVESGSNEKSMSYDGNGNLSFYGSGTAGKHYVYDSEKRMVKYYDTTSASYESADVTLYEYDALGRRISKSSATGGASESGALYEAYSYAGERVIADYNGEGDIRYRFVYGEGIDEVVCIMKTTVEGEPRYFGYFTDHLGSVVTLYRHNPLRETDPNSIVDRYTYDAYGNVSIDDIDNWYNGNQYMFTGRRYDAESGLYYYRARMYNPELGVFQSQDPLGYIDSMNLYAYCANNPLNYVDPLGTGLSSVESPVTLTGTGLAGKELADVLGIAAVAGTGSAAVEAAHKTGLWDKVVEWVGNLFGKSEKDCNKDKWDDLQSNPDDWEIVDENISPGKKGGESTRRKYRNKKTGDEIGYHDVDGQKTKHPHPHLKPPELWDVGD